MTISELLYEYLDYKCVWQSKKESEHAIIKYEKFNSLLERHGLSRKHANPKYNNLEYGSSDGTSWNRAEELERITDLQYFENGEFFRDKEYINYKDFSQKIHEYAKINNLRYKRHAYDDILSVDWMFNKLLRFRIRLYEFCLPNEEMYKREQIALSYVNLYIEELKQKIRQNTKNLDEILCFMMDPQNHKCNVDRLKTNIDFQKTKFDDIYQTWLTTAPEE